MTFNHKNLFISSEDYCHKLYCFSFVVLVCSCCLAFLYCCFFTLLLFF